MAALSNERQPLRGSAVSELEAQFDQLGDNVARLIALLQEADEAFWIPYLERSLVRIREHKLAGATFVLGCYGGTGTFSDLVIGRQYQARDPITFRNLNARLSHLRTETFECANAITSRRAW